MKRLIFILILLLSATLYGGSGVDTIDHDDSIWDCLLSVRNGTCCGFDPYDEDCGKINMGISGYFGIGRSSTDIYTSLFGFHLGGRDTTDLDSVMLYVYCYTETSAEADSFLPLAVNPLLKAIETVYGDSLHNRYGAHYFNECEVDINDSSPTGIYQIRDSADGVGVIWQYSRATAQGVDFDSLVEDNDTINGTGWHGVPITNCVRAAIDSGNTYCDMILRDIESYYKFLVHDLTARTNGSMNFRSRQSAYSNDPYVVFYYVEEDKGTSRRRKIIMMVLPTLFSVGLAIQNIRRSK